MKPTVEQVRAVFQGQEPSRGGWGSKFTFEETDTGVRVNLVAEWLPRYLTPSGEVRGLEGDEVLWWDGQKVKRYTVETVADLLADSDE